MCSSTPGEYLLWFRPEQVRTVTWGGDPRKPVLVGDDPSQLSPRRSFAQWHQLVEGTSARWSGPDLAAARLIGESVTDVVLQFRSVRMLIAQDQLHQVSGQVRLAEQPVVVADAAGRIILTNAAFDRLLPHASRPLEQIEELADCCTDAIATRHAVRELLTHRRSWRGEVRLTTEPGASRPLQVRADPVLASSDRLLGYVLLFSDLTGRRAVETARRRFQEDVIERHQAISVQLDSKSDLVFRQLLTVVVANAQLAALEITDGVDLGRMPDMLENVRTSVTRTAELLEHLIRYARSASDRGDDR